MTEATSKPTILAVENVSKTFGGLKAVDAVSFQVKDGQVFTMIGPNGAGKTTLFNVLTGIYRPTTGEVKFNDRPIGGVPPHRVTHPGMGRTSHNTRIFGQPAAGR